MSQMAVFLAYANLDVNLWSWVDADLYLPKHWFEPDKAALKAKLGVPAEREFATKWQLGLAMILKAHTQGLPFERVARDANYGHRGAFRHALDQVGILYCADVGKDERVFLACPAFGVPPATGKGRPFCLKSDLVLFELAGQGRQPLRKIDLKLIGIGI